VRDNPATHAKSATVHGQSGAAWIVCNAREIRSSANLTKPSRSENNIDIGYAHIALAISSNPKIHVFAKTMIRDHNAVNRQALALLTKLNAQPQNNFLSRQLTEGSIELVEEMSRIRGAAFEKRYAANELAYHQAVNNLVETAFIPNIENAEVKALFEAGLKIF
jgi:putative membrane protein